MNKAAGTIWNEAKMEHPWLYDPWFWGACVFLCSTSAALGFWAGIAEKKWPAHNVIDLAAEREKRRMVG